MSFLFWFIAFCLNIFSVNPQVLKDSTKYHSHDSRQLDSQNISHAHRHIVNKDLFEALGFLNNVLQPDNCVGLDYAVVRIGNGGGFASQFQLVGGEWMRAFAYLNYSKPVLIQGNIRGYSDGKQCDHVNHDWTCFFFELSSCQKELLKTGKRLEIPSTSYNFNQHVPPIFAHLGPAFWWGVVQYKMFRILPFVEKYIMDESNNMNNGKGFPFGLPTAGMHVRHGDKSSDGFLDHSLLEEINVMRNSSDCYVMNKAGFCFSLINHDSPSTITSILKAVNHHQTVVLELDTIDNYNPASRVYNKSEDRLISVLHSRLHRHLKPTVHSSGSLHRPVLVNVSTHANHQKLHTMEPDTLILVTPLHVFVASDDANVTQAASYLNYMTFRTGVSQTADAKVGMAHTLNAHHEMGYNASLEIISDIYLLSKCSTLLGISASQVFRMAVALSNVTGILRHAVAMDTDQIKKIEEMSVSYHVPFPEKFSV